VDTSLLSSPWIGLAWALLGVKSGLLVVVGGFLLT